MRRRIRVAGQGGGGTGAYPGHFSVSQRFVHCVELGFGQDLGQGQGRVVVEWGGEPDLDGDGVGNLEMIVRYRCGSFPEVGEIDRITYSIYTYIHVSSCSCSFVAGGQLLLAHLQRPAQMQITRGTLSVTDYAARYAVAMHVSFLCTGLASGGADPT